MSVLKVKFADPIDVSCFTEFAAQLDGFKILGDWHEYRLRTIANLKISDDCAPARSIRHAREKHGPTLHIQLQLQDGVTLEGGLGSTGILIGNGKVATHAIMGDPAVQSFLDGLREFTEVKSVEVI